MNEDDFKRLVVNNLDDISARLKHVEDQLDGLQIRWARLTGGAAVVGTLLGWFAETLLSWI